ncbi:MAG: hypothetical protein U0269_12105 [Polyangiales bacterium]
MSVDASTPDAASSADACASSTPVAEIQWTEVGPFARAVDHHGTWIFEGPSGASLYVAGGIRQGAGEQLEAVYNQVSRAEIQADGTLGPWRDDSALPVATGFHGLARVGSRVYLAGGLTNNGTGVALSRRVFVGEKGADGALAWRETAALPWGALHPTLTQLDDSLVLVGGTNGQSAQNMVAVARIQADGSLGEWTRAANTPEPRSHHFAFVQDGSLYLAGGFRGMPVGNNITPLAAILRSQRDARGAITGWTEVGSMDPVRFTHAGFVRQRQLYVIGGLYESGEIDIVQRAEIQCDGTVAAPSEVRGALPFVRSHVHQTPVFNDRVYSVAGRDANGVSMSRVVIGALR